jgi:molybdopterin converting factor small subunit
MKGKNFKFLCEAYPEWIEHVRMMNSAYKSIVNLQRKIRQYLKKKKEEQEERLDTNERELQELEKKLSPEYPKEKEANSPELKDKKDFAVSSNNIARTSGHKPTGGRSKAYFIFKIDRNYEILQCSLQQRSQKSSQKQKVFPQASLKNPYHN